MNSDLFPHVNGVPNMSAVGRFALAYQRPNDLHQTIIFNEVSEDFIDEYLVTRTWVREAINDMGWRFEKMRAIVTEGTVQ